MEEGINRKPLIIIAIMAIIILVIMLFQMRNDDNKQDNHNSETLKSDKVLSMDDAYVPIVRLIVKKNSDWSKLPLSDNFKSKYNSKDGILANDNFDSLDSCTILSSNEEQIVVLNIGHGYRYDNYYFHYDLNDKNELDDVQLIKTEVTQYAEGLTPTIASEPSYINKNNYKNAITHLSTPYMYEFDGVETTENFKKKYGNGFGDESEFEYIDFADQIEKLSSWDDKIVYLGKYGKKKGTDEEYSKYFKVHFYLDDENRVDDIDIEYVPNEEIRRLCGTDKEQK